MGAIDLTDPDIIAMVNAWARLGLSRSAIARNLGCAPGTFARWLSQPDGEAMQRTISDAEFDAEYELTRLLWSIARDPKSRGRHGAINMLLARFDRDE